MSLTSSGVGLFVFLPCTAGLEPRAMCSHRKCVAFRLFTNLVLGDVVTARDPYIAQPYQGVPIGGGGKKRGTPSRAFMSHSKTWGIFQELSEKGMLCIF